MLILIKIKSICKTLLNKIKKEFIKNEDEKQDNKIKVPVKNYCKPTSIQVIKLKKWFEDDGKNSTGNGSPQPECTYEIFLSYINKKESAGEPFPETKEIESDLGIGRNKRLKFCGQTVEEGLLYKPTSNSFDWIKNKGGNDNE